MPGEEPKPPVLPWREEFGSALRLPPSLLLMQDLGEMQLKSPGCFFRTHGTVAPLGKVEERCFFLQWLLAIVLIDHYWHPREDEVAVVQAEFQAGLHET